MRVRVVTDTGEEIEGPFLLRLSGWTEERYFQEAPEDRIWEFEDGEVIVHSPATLLHQRLVGFLTLLLKGYAEVRGLGEVLNGPAVLRLRPGAAKEPDLFFIHRDRRSNIREEWVDATSIAAREVRRCIVKGKTGGSQRLAREGSLAGDEGGGSPRGRG